MSDKRNELQQLLGQLKSTNAKTLDLFSTKVLAPRRAVYRRQLKHEAFSD
ncbi:MAG: hypothetical protein P1V97_05440 [Planctomycetota bacterium]|nr:hypothetical protein [Planctomycetota bacterium]